MTKDQRTTPYPLRMPARLREQIDTEAKDNGRSLNAEILHRLEEYNWVAAESQERRDIADHLMRERVQLLEDLTEKSEELHRAKSEIIKLTEALQQLGGPANDMPQLVYDRIKRELKDELLGEISDYVRDIAEEVVSERIPEREELRD